MNRKSFLKKMNLKEKNSILFFILLAVSLMITGCNSDDDNDGEYGNWVERSAFDGDSRGNSVSFTIGDKGYLITGYDGDDYLYDTWEYNSEDDYWVKKANFPGTARSGAVGFSINDKGYIGTGYDGDNKLKDFWEYNPTTNKWTKKADFGGTARYGAIGFSVNGNGYIGTGYDGSEQKDFWKYDVTNDTWEQVVGFGGQKRQNASVFVINDVAYIGTGIHNGAVEYDFYAFNGTTWTRLNDIDDVKIALYSSVGFTLNGKGYFATGISGSITNSCWEYKPSTDSWEDNIPKFEGSARQDACAFSFDTKAYILMGRSSSSFFDDIWEYKPNEIVNKDD